MAEYRPWITIIVGIVSFVQLFLYQQIFETNPGLNFAIALGATLSGVIIAFDLDRFFESVRDKERKRRLLKDLRDELKRAITYIYPAADNTYLVYPDIWDAKIYSGEIKLLKSNELTQFADIYRKIKGIDYEAARLRDTENLWKQTPPEEATIKPYLEKRVQYLLNRHVERCTGVTEDIGKLFNKSWFKLEEN